MLLKKRYLFLILLVCLLAISAVSAEEISNETNIVANDYDSSLITESVNEDILTDSYGTFQELQEEINAVGKGGTLNLTRNYKYVDGSTDGIIIGKPITIDGQGHTIDGNKLSRIFNVYANNITLRNINIINGKSVGSAGAIHWEGVNGKIINSTFENCTTIRAYKTNNACGGAIFITSASDDFYVGGCKFVNNSAVRGGSIEVNSKGIITNCSFENNCIDEISDSYAAAIDIWYTDNVIIDNCIFKNNSANYAGAICLFYSDYGCILNCTFLNNFASEWGSAIIYSFSNDGIVQNCSFINNSFESHTILWYVASGSMNNSYFDPDFGNIAFFNSHDVDIIKNYSVLVTNNLTINYGNSDIFLASLDIINKFNKKITFVLTNDEIKIHIVSYSNLEGIASFSDELAELNVGIWDVYVLFEGNDNYYPCDATATINVLPQSSSLTIGDVNTYVGHETSLTVNITSNHSVNEGIVTFFDGKTNIGEANVVDGKATLTYTPTTAGKHTITAVFNSDNYLSSNDTSVLSVKKANIDLTIADIAPVLFTNPSNFAVNVNSNYKAVNEGKIKYYVNNDLVGTVNVNDGVANLDYVTNTAGSFTLVAVYDETSNYLASNATATFIVKDTVIAKDFTKIFRNGTQYQGTFVDSQGNLIRNKDIEININGVFYTRKTNDNGVAQMNINLPPGTYILTATNPLSKEQHTTKVTVLPSIVENYDLTKYYKNASKYTLRIIGDDGKPVGEGVTVKLNINGVFYERKTNATGYMNMNINLPPGTYTVTAEYNGLRASNKITVLSVLETNDLVMKYHDGSQFKAKVLDGQGKPYAGQTVTFNINGVFYTKTTEADGIARLKINLLAGEYIITSMYNGLNSANKVTISG